MGNHIIDGEFQSDKYPTCPRGKVPLSVKDPTAQDLLWEYAQRRRTVDTEFSDDLEAALRAKGYEPKAWKHAGRPTADETVAMARRYMDNANREAARMAVGVVLMYEELIKLRERCLCKGTFRCTPCLEEMELEGRGDAESELVAATDERDQISNSLDQAARDGGEFHRLQDAILDTMKRQPNECPEAHRESYVIGWINALDHLVSQLRSEGLMPS